MSRENFATDLANVIMQYRQDKTFLQEMMNWLEKNNCSLKTIALASPTAAIKFLDATPIALKLTTDELIYIAFRHCESNSYKMQYLDAVRNHEITPGCSLFDIYNSVDYSDPRNLDRPLTAQQRRIESIFLNNPDLMELVIEEKNLKYSGDAKEQAKQAQKQAQQAVEQFVGDPYKILGIEKNAKESDIKKAYFKLSKEYHPDKNPSDAARKIFELINKAYILLTNPTARKYYDDNAKINPPEQKKYRP